MSVRALTALATLALTTVLTLPGAAASRTLPVRDTQVEVAKSTKSTKQTAKQTAQQQQQLSRLARTVSRLQIATWACQDNLGVDRSRASTSPWALPRSVAYRKWAASRWTQEHVACKAAAKEKKRQWNWQAFPAWIIQLARCESSINWFAEGSSSDGVFYSAFNISRSQYDIDAHHMGVRGWHEGPGVPSPYEQAMAVIGHMRLLGDGWTGRCHGIARSSWN